MIFVQETDHLILDFYLEFKSYFSLTKQNKKSYFSLRLTFFLFFFIFFFPKTGSHHALAVLELTMKIRLASNS